MGLAVAVLAVGLVLFLVLGSALRDEVGTDQAVTDVAEESVSTQAYREVEIGTSKEQVTQNLLPARPVDTQVLDRYQQRAPETVSSSCVYYESEGGPADDLLRFCFEDDELVDKTVVLPEEPGPAG